MADQSAPRIKVHVKNNRWAEGSFPNTPDGERVFTITQERIDLALEGYPNLRDRLEFYVDWDTDNFATSMADSDVLLTWNFPTDDLPSVAPKLQWIHCIGAGVEHLLPMDWLPDSIALTNNKGVHAAKAGEYCLMAVLMLHARMPAIISNQRKGLYDSLYCSPIAGKTVVVVGTGSLGGAGAQQIQRLGAHVIGVNRSGRAVAGCDEVFSTSELDNCLKRADYLLLAAPDTPQTRGLMDRRRLDLLKPGAGIVNIGRESIMDYNALCDKLEDGSLAGAVLDVFDPEPIDPNSRLWDTPNLVITPHVSADDGDAYIPLTLGLFFDNMRKFLAGEALLNRIDPALGY